MASLSARGPAIDRFDEPVRAATETDRAKFRERVLKYKRNAKDAVHFVFGIFERRSGEFIGQIDFFLINKHLAWANLGYNIHNQYANQGFATEAATLALRHGFEKLKFHRIEAATEVANKASQRVALKAGLLREGKRRKFFPQNGGVDMVVFAKNAIDYRKN
jgi:RimJ/RimL family protein N-acetyltransferase